MYRLTKTQAFLAPVALIVSMGTMTGAHADYQQTLAAQGADAYATTPIVVEIDNAALADTFANNIVEANPAMSDQEVMIELNARMQAEQRLEQAAANLDPAAVATVITQTNPPTPETTKSAQTTAEQKTALESAAAAVASR